MKWHANFSRVQHPPLLAIKKLHNSHEIIRLEKWFCLRLTLLQAGKFNSFLKVFSSGGFNSAPLIILNWELFPPFRRSYEKLEALAILPFLNIKYTFNIYSCFALNFMNFYEFFLQMSTCMLNSFERLQIYNNDLFYIYRLR